jgi:excisionase family DNA binding protein
MAQPPLPLGTQLAMSFTNAERGRARSAAPAPLGAQLIRPEQAAVLLNIGRTKVYELMARGDLESVSIDRRRLIPVEAVREFVDRLRHNHSG